MKITIDTKKSAEAVSNVLQKTADISKKAAEGVQKGAKAISEKTKEENYLRRMKKYNPLFWEQYNSKEFHIPNMIVIVDDAVRRGIDVCQGAIGWLSKEKDMEVLFLYDEAVNMSGIQFVPTIVCDAAYYVDSFDHSRFIRIDYIFSKAHEERMAELKHVAYSLGAKYCSIEICEANVEARQKKRQLSKGGKLKGFNFPATEDFESTVSYSDSNQRRGKIEAKFKGSDITQKPELKWFAHDGNINKLIEMRCKKDNFIKSELLELSGATCATMSKKTASGIDWAVSKIGVENTLEMESQAVRENLSTLKFYIEF